MIQSSRAQQYAVQAAHDTAATREIARKERERLKAQDKFKREQLEKLRAEQNMDASAGEVRATSWLAGLHKYLA